MCDIFNCILSIVITTIIFGTIFYFAESDYTSQVVKKSIAKTSTEIINKIANSSKSD